LASNQRLIKFTVSSPTLKNRENITYHYQLKGYDTLWTINRYEQHEIVYNALSHGDYTFAVKAENQGVFSDTLYYSFTIKPPYYLTWWFSTLWIVVFVAIVMFT